MNPSSVSGQAIETLACIGVFYIMLKTGEVRCGVAQGKVLETWMKYL